MLADDHPLRRLAEQYPASFKLVGQERQPVKIGIGDELAALDTGLTSSQLRRALATYVRHSGYQCNIREGVNRIGLDGMPVGVITVEEAAHAKKMLARLAAKRARQDAAKIATRNQRLAAIRALAAFVAEHSPVHIEWCGQIRSIPFKRAGKAVVPYLEKAEMDALLAAPDHRTAQGRRDCALLLFLYNSGARATEAAQLKVRDLDIRAA
jgi:site-specific recombinase XerC